MIRLTTESGSVYELDTDAKTVRRLPRPGAGVNVLRHDGRAHAYHQIVNGPTVGEPFVYVHDLSTRITTPVVSVEDAGS